MHFTLCDLVADIAQNAAESGAALVQAEIAESGDFFRLVIADNGKGMTEDELERAKNPFHSDGIKHPGRKVGLGIPFLIQTATQSGGAWEIDSRKGIGTKVTASFDLRNIDTPPIGDVAGLCRTVLMFPGPGEVEIRRIREGSGPALDYTLRKSELMEALGGLEDAGALALLGQYLRSMEEQE